MIEGGGLGVFRPEEVGPVSVQVPNGVVDVLCADEKEAVEVARRYLSYFQGDRRDWAAPTRRACATSCRRTGARSTTCAGRSSCWPTRGRCSSCGLGFAPGMVTALARVEGRPVGVVANNPLHLAGAIDADGADKAARFMQLCEAFGLPLLSLCDTPGFMVGPEAEETALVRHVSRMFVVGASLTVPFAASCCARATGSGPRPWPGELPPTPLHRGLAHRRAGRHGPRGRGAPGFPPGARGHRGPGRA